MQHHDTNSIGHHSIRLTRSTYRPPNCYRYHHTAIVGAGVGGGGARVREVEAEDVHAGGDKALERRLSRRGHRRADNLRLAQHLQGARKPSAATALVLHCQL